MDRCASFLLSASRRDGTKVAMTSIAVGRGARKQARVNAASLIVE
jgi:hypothetical protein